MLEVVNVIYNLIIIIVICKIYIGYYRMEQDVGYKMWDML